jgi:Flp pilus assembly protein TadD
LKLLAGQPADAELDRLGPAARAATARMLLGRKREAEAIRVLEPAVPEAGATMMLAAIHGNAGRLDEAAALLDRVLVGDPGNARALAQRGLVRAKQGRFADAERDLAASLAIDPGQPDVAANLDRLRRR